MDERQGIQVTLSVVCWDFNHKSQQSPNSLYWNSFRKFLIHILNHLPTHWRAPPRGPACDHLLVHLWQVQRGSRQPRPEGPSWGVKMRPYRDAAGVLKSCFRNTVPFFIIYFIVEATETNVCASLESHSSVSTSTSPAWQLTQQNASLFHWGWHCQQCSKGICQDGVLANDVVFIGQGLKANQCHHLVALWTHATAIQAGYPSNIHNINCRYNYRIIKLKHSFVQLHTSLSGLHVPSHLLLENCISPFRTASVALLRRLLVASNAWGRRSSKTDDGWIPWIFRGAPRLQALNFSVQNSFSKGWHPQIFLSVQVLLVRDSQFYSN